MKHLKTATRMVPVKADEKWHGMGIGKGGGILNTILCLTLGKIGLINDVYCS